LYPLIRAALLACLALLPLAAAKAELLSPGDRQAYRAAFNAVARGGDFGPAWRRADEAQDPLLRKVLRWIELTRGGGSFAQVTEFIDQNPDWPSQLALRQRAEEAISGAPDATARAWLQKFPPVTPYGKFRQADLLIQSGQREAGIALIREVWINGDLSGFDEQSLLQRYAGVIRKEDHLKRLDRLVWDGNEDQARRMYPRVPPEWRTLAHARFRLAEMAPGVEKLVAKVPANLQNDPGLLYERARWRRRKEMFDTALEIVANPPRELGRPTAWWTERQILARRALADGKPQLAYKLVSKHGLAEGSAQAEAEFLSGWIALRFLNDAKTGYDHFVRLYDSVKLPISASRGAYWAGRAAEAQGQKQLAASWYGTAADHYTTYYGQLAAARMGHEAPPRVLPEPQPTASEIAAFEKKELVRAVHMLAEIGENDRFKPFLLRLSESSKSPSDHALIAILAESLGRLDLSVSVAKRAGYAGVPLMRHGYPIVSIPNLGGIAERPLVLAMTRQESAFDREAVSKAGARGLMQLMPATAKMMAKSMALPYSADRLLSDGSYNLTLGRQYLDGLLDSFNGSYVLAVAGYNAGPARVRQWMRDFGDPRAKETDGVDWVEAIPYGETRNYVQRVLENLQIYRVRLGDEKLAFSLPRDLKR
jgi:soluble lytic murein transglycosylase